MSKDCYMSNNPLQFSSTSVSLQSPKPPVKQHRLSQSVALALPVAGGMLMALPVMAQQPVEEIIIIDSQRDGYVQEISSLSHFSESLLDTPQSITTLTDDMLQD